MVVRLLKKVGKFTAYLELSPTSLMPIQTAIRDLEGARKVWRTGAP